MDNLLFSTHLHCSLLNQNLAQFLEEVTGKVFWTLATRTVNLKVRSVTGRQLIQSSAVPSKTILLCLVCSRLAPTKKQTFASLSPLRENFTQTMVQYFVYYHCDDVMRNAYLIKLVHVSMYFLYLGRWTVSLGNLGVRRVVGRGASNAVSLVRDSAGYHLPVDSLL